MFGSCGRNGFMLLHFIMVWMAHAARSIWTGSFVTLVSLLSWSPCWLFVVIVTCCQDLICFCCAGFWMGMGFRRAKKSIGWMVAKRWCSLTPSCGDTGAFCGCSSACFFFFCCCCCKWTIRRSRPLFLPVCPHNAFKVSVLRTVRTLLLMNMVIFSEQKRGYFIVWMTFNWHCGWNLKMSDISDGKHNLFHLFHVCCLDVDHGVA